MKNNLILRVAKNALYIRYTFIIFPGYRISFKRTMIYSKNTRYVPVDLQRYVYLISELPVFIFPIIINLRRRLARVVLDI